MKNDQLSPLSRLFAVVPAAGRGRRFAEAGGGGSKLLALVPNTKGLTVIGRLLSWLERLPLDGIYVSALATDSTLRDEISRYAAKSVLFDERPTEMRDSVEAILSHITARENPTVADGWLLIPADHAPPSIAFGRVLIAGWHAAPERIVTPIFAGRTGHPTLFPWHLSRELSSYPRTVGVNNLRVQHPELLLAIPTTDPAVLHDIDTPEDLEVVPTRNILD